MPRHIASEVLVEIFLYLTPQELLVLSLACKVYQSASEVTYQYHTAKLLEEKDNSKPEESSYKHHFFIHVKPIIKQLTTNFHQEITRPQKGIVAYLPYQNQVNLAPFIGSECKFAAQVLTNYIRHHDINYSDEYGLTLLHNLLWFKRLDLAKQLIENENFHKINFKFCLPNGMYASALDFAIGMWFTRECPVGLDFIELFLKHGALPPKPDKKFIDNESLTYFLPSICSIDGHRTQEDTAQLLALLSLYGFDLDGMKRYYHKRLVTDGVHKQFTSTYALTLAQQQDNLASCFTSVERQLENNVPRLPVVPMDEARLDNGKTSLALPFDPADAAFYNQGCNIS